jgi:hypothetical protein
MPLLFFVPSKINLPVKPYQPSPSYSSLPADCENKTLLELPPYSTIPGEIGKYKKNVLFSTKYHSCNLLNGYSSTMPKENYEMMNSLWNPNENNLLDLINKYNVDFVKINKNEEMVGWDMTREKLLPYFLLCSHYYEDKDTVILDCSAAGNSKKEQ